jgi:hypothetical protein
LLLACAAGLVQAQGSNHWGSKNKGCSMTDKRASYLLKLWDGHIATGAAAAHQLSFMYELLVSLS